VLVGESPVLVKPENQVSVRKKVIGKPCEVKLHARLNRGRVV